MSKFPSLPSNLKILQRLSVIMSSIRLSKDSIKFSPEDGKLILAYDDISNTSEWPDGPLLELTKGELYVVPSPSVTHQMISQKLNVLLYNFLQESKLGVVIPAPIDVKLSEYDVVIPDLLFIQENRKEIIAETHINGPPDLIVEILSSNRKRDLVEKKQQYEKFRIKEYVVVDPLQKQIIQFLFDQNSNIFEEKTFSGNENFNLKTIEGFSINLNELFDV